MQAGDHNRAEQLQNTTPEGLRFNELRPGQLDYQMHYPEPGDSKREIEIDDRPPDDGCTNDFSLRTRQQ